MVSGRPAESVFKRRTEGSCPSKDRSRAIFRQARTPARSRDYEARSSRRASTPSCPSRRREGSLSPRFQRRRDSSRTMWRCRVGSSRGRAGRRLSRPRRALGHLCSLRGRRCRIRSRVLSVDRRRRWTRSYQEGESGVREINLSGAKKEKRQNALESGSRSQTLDSVVVRRRIEALAIGDNIDHETGVTRALDGSGSSLGRDLKDAARRIAAEEGLGDRVSRDGSDGVLVYG
jgi:hypothetical protein